MTVHDVLIQYQARLGELQTGIAQLRLPHALSASVLGIALGLFLALGIYAIRKDISFVWPSLPIPVVAVSARRLQRNRETRFRMWRLKRFYGRAVQRVNGNWAGLGVTGQEFSDPGHVYARDLDVVGEGSLFELLCTVRTSIGQRGLADYLLEPSPLDETLLRQDAVRELRSRTELREKVATLGAAEFSESHHETFDDWLTSPQPSFNPSVPILAALTSGLLAVAVLLGLLGMVSWISVGIWISPLITFHVGVGLFFRNRVIRMLKVLLPVAGEIGVLQEGLLLLASERFHSDKLRQLSEQVRNAPESIRKLQRLLDALGQRDKDWFYGPSRIFLAGTQLCIAIERWRETHGEELRIWLRAWGEFEALNALAGYGYENPDHTFPECSKGEAGFVANELRHPLLPQTACVANDVELSHGSPFYVISGSNMSGKSTLLRAIGLNAVLAFAGAPVRAHALRLSGLSIFASMSVVDSLLNGKSKFLAEVGRLRQAIEASQNRPVLFLVDEIFSGTNSHDRRIAAEAVVRTLVDRGAIGALSTHDLALTEIAGSGNVHMGSRDQSDPMDFDYRLKPGVTQEANALAIARMAGVPV